jgi:hypothetical protein
VWGGRRNRCGTLPLQTIAHHGVALRDFDLVYDRFGPTRAIALVLVPGVIFGVPIIGSAIALIYFPEVLARPWPKVLSATPVGLIQDIAGVAPNERRRLGALCFAVLVFGVVVVQNLLERNWLKWFGTSPPILLATPAVSLSMYFLFLLVPLTLAHYVLTGDGRAAEASH